MIYQSLAFALLASAVFGAPVQEHFHGQHGAQSLIGNGFQVRSMSSGQAPLEEQSNLEILASLAQRCADSKSQVEQEQSAKSLSAISQQQKSAVSQNIELPLTQQLSIEANLPQKSAGLSQETPLAQQANQAISSETQQKSGAAQNFALTQQLTAGASLPQKSANLALESALEQQLTNAFTGENQKKSEVNHAHETLLAQALSHNQKSAGVEQESSVEQLSQPIASAHVHRRSSASNQALDSQMEQAIMQDLHQRSAAFRNAMAMKHQKPMFASQANLRSAHFEQEFPIQETASAHLHQRSLNAEHGMEMQQHMPVHGSQAFFRSASVEQEIPLEQALEAGIHQRSMNLEQEMPLHQTQMQYRSIGHAHESPLYVYEN